MIDKLVLRCDFAKIPNGFTPLGKQQSFGWPMMRLPELGIPLDKSFDAEGQEINCRHPFESIPSSFEGMAFKVFDHRFDPLDSFYIEIKASPAKIMQGHNVYGSDDIYDCSMHMLELLCNTYPQITELLDHTTWYLAQIDITYSSRARSEEDAKSFINALKNVSYGHTKNRDGVGTTAYFGKKNSRLKKIKVYLKLLEVLETIKKNDTKTDGHLLNELYTPDLLDFANSLIRWEVSLYHRYFERLGLSCYLKDIFKNNTFASEHLKNYWRLATSDLFAALRGQTMKIIKDDDIQKQLRAQFTKYGKKTGKPSTAAADAAFRTFRDIRRDGWEIARSSMVLRTFNRHISMLVDCGLSRAALQNMTGLNDGAQIIPFVRFIQVDFAAQFPENYQQPPPKHVYQPEPCLRLVA